MTDASEVRRAGEPLSGTRGLHRANRRDHLLARGPVPDGAIRLNLRHHVGESSDDLSGTDRETDMRAQVGAAWCGAALVGVLVGSVPRLHAQTVSLDNVPPIALTTSTTVSAVDIDVASGNVFVRSAVGSYSQCTAAASSFGINFFPTSSVVLWGAPITLNWSTAIAAACSPQQGSGSGTIWGSLGTLPASPGPPPSIASYTLNAPLVTQNTPITFQINCGNGSSNASAQTVVTVQGSGGDCIPIYPNGIVTSWDGVFGPWPGYNNRRRIVSVPGNGYIAWSFVATSVAGQFGSISAQVFPGDGDGDGQMSISRTPGCFTASELGANCLGLVNRFPGVSWRNGTGNQFQCALTPGQTYYVNFTYGNATTGQGPHCPAGPGQCGADVTNVPQ